MMDKSDEQLIAEYQQGRDEAMETIFIRYQKTILNFALRFMGNRADAEDVATEVFLPLLKNRDCYTQNARAKFSTWLYTVARNACLTKIRKRKESPAFFWPTSDSAEEEPSGIQIQDTIQDRETPSDHLRKKELALALRQAVQRLPLAQREAFVLREFHGLSYEEIVQVTGNSLANVKVLIFRAREELRKNLGRFLGEVQS